MQKLLLTFVFLGFILPGCTPSSEPSPETGGPSDSSQQPDTQPNDDSGKGPQSSLSETVKDNLKTGSARLDPLVPQGKPSDSVAKPDMQRLASGVEYALLQEGTGQSPPLNATLKVHVTGWLKQGPNVGRKFWNSRKHGRTEPMRLSKDDMISGLVEVVQTMKRGERRWILVPSELGYGVNGYLGIVPGRSDLILDLELVDFEAPTLTR